MTLEAYLLYMHIGIYIYFLAIQCIVCSLGMFSNADA